jgi:hypothetical protein
MWEAEIGRIMVLSQPREGEVFKTPSQWKNLGIVAHAYHSSYAESINRRIVV